MADSHPPSQSPSSSQQPPEPQPTQPDHPIEPKPDPEAPNPADLDATIDQHIEMNPPDPSTQPQDTAPDTDMLAAGTGNPVQEPGPEPVDALAAASASAPSKKETSLREFLGKMDDYTPIVLPLLFPFPSSLQCPPTDAM